MPTRNLIVLILCAAISLLCYRTASRNHFGGLLAAAIGEIRDDFVRPVEERMLFEGAMDGMVRQLDPYSDYISPKELTEFQQDLDQKFGGIGIVVEVNPTTNKLTVLSPLPDTPAFSAGMRAGDLILAIDGQSTDGFQIMDAVKLMRGDPGAPLTVTIQHAGESETVDLRITRAIIPIASVLGDIRNGDGTWQYRLESEPRIGYIRLVSFGDKTATELRQTIQSLQSMDGLILDLRGNGGGLLNSAIAVCDMFISEGTIVSIRGRDRNQWRDYSATPAATLLPDLPLAVLVDGYSASASEITAACLQDHHRAIVVGQRTWGKGTVQNVMPFEGGQSALKLTVATYWRPSGFNIHRHVDAQESDGWGVSPDDGYDVTVDETTLKKILLLRRERDRVQIQAPTPLDVDEESLGDRDSVAAVGSSPSEPGEPSAAGTIEGQTTTDAEPVDTAIDLRGFEDPQLRRAIEAIWRQIGAKGDERSAA